MSVRSRRCSRFWRRNIVCCLAGSIVPFIMAGSYRSEVLTDNTLDERRLFAVLLEDHESHSCSALVSMEI